MKLWDRLHRFSLRFKPEEIGCGVTGHSPAGPNMIRYELFAWRGFKIRLHRWLRSDADPMHDHPVHGISILLTGSYLEETPAETKRRRTGSIQIIRASHVHRVLVDPDCRCPIVWSLFLNTPKVQEWGFFPRAIKVHFMEWIRKNPCHKQKPKNE